MTQYPHSEIPKGRKSTYPIDSIFLNRYSPRAMTGDSLQKEDILLLLEAARWAPSSYNNQPWRFAFALKEDARWSSFLNLLVPFNQNWAQNASALLILISKKTFEHNGKWSKTHSFDTGAAWAFLALQGSMRGLVVHGMEGFNYEKAHMLLNLSEDYQIEAMAAIGHKASSLTLSKDLREKEKPSTRKPLKDLLF